MYRRRRSSRLQGRWRTQLVVGEKLESRMLLTATADLDGDGDLDAYLGNSWFENVDGRGNFRGFEFSDQPFEIAAVADMDGDGDLDIVSSEPRWYENVPGTGRFETAHLFPIDAIPGSDVRPGDFNSDGHHDVLVFSGSIVSLYENIDGTGTLELKFRTEVDGTEAAADVNGDGDLDLAVVRRTESLDQLLLFTSDGKGGYLEEVVDQQITDADGTATIDHVSFEDIDKDGVMDLVEAISSMDNFTFIPQSSIRYFVNRAGRFPSPTQIGSTIYGDNRLLDVDHDGDLDYLSTNQMSGSFRWLSNDGAGQFHPPGQTPQLHELRNLSIDWDIVDVDGNGVLDIITDDFQDGAPVWTDGRTGAAHLNVLPPIGSLRAGDSNKDFYFDEADLIQVAARGRYFADDATWEAGDWTGAPGGTVDVPPLGDGRFDETDLDAAYSTSLYRRGALDADAKTPIDETQALRLGIANADLTLSYIAATGQVQVVNHGDPLTAFRLVSESSMLNYEVLDDFDGRFDVRSSDSVFRFDLDGFANVELNAALPPQLSWFTLSNDLRIDGARLGGGGLGNVRLTCSDCELDIDAFQQAMRDQVWRADWDFTRDGRLDQADLRFLVHEMLYSSLGDSNFDGEFNSRDLVYVFESPEYEDDIVGNSVWSEGDWNGDGDFTSRDLVFAFADGKYSGGAEPNPSTPPSDIRFEVNEVNQGLHSNVSAAADFDGDGDLDLVITAYSEPSVVWLENMRDGLFETRHLIDDDVPEITAEHVVDLDQDGDQDLVIAKESYFGSNEIVWYENINGRGDFSSPRLISPEIGAISLTVNDIDGDGLGDILAGGLRTGLRWYKNPGELGATWASRVLIPEIEIRGVDLKDLDQDGRLDVVAHSHEDTIWLRNEGAEAFGDSRFIATDLLLVDIGDIDRDGDLDLVGSQHDGQLVKLLNNGRGEFASHSIRDVEGGRQALYLADLDGDTHLDVVATGYFENLWLGNSNGDGQFDEPVSIPFNRPDTILVHDVDNDDDRDLIFGSGLVMKNDGRGSFARFDEFQLGNGYAGNVLVGDLDQDGDLDVILEEGQIVWRRNAFGEAGFSQVMLVTDTVARVRKQLEQLADIDSDGDLDVLVISRNQDWIGWYENENGEGLMSDRHEILVDTDSPEWALAGDIDGDGANDVVAFTGSRLVWFRNLNQRGRFGQPRVIDDGREAEDAQLVDLDRDGDLDIVTTHVWFENSGSGTFTVGSWERLSDGDLIVATDLDGDGDNDIVRSGEAAIDWFVNDGGARFVETRRVTSISSASAMIAFDLDRDEDEDLVVASSSGTVTWLRNDGSGVFESRRLIDDDGRYVSVDVADLDADGDFDIIVADTDNNRVLWFESMPVIA